jgi:hypothetical protein
MTRCRFLQDIPEWEGKYCDKQFFIVCDKKKSRKIGGGAEEFLAKEKLKNFLLFSWKKRFSSKSVEVVGKWNESEV